MTHCTSCATFGVDPTFPLSLRGKLAQLVQCVTFSLHGLPGPLGAPGGQPGARQRRAACAGSPPKRLFGPPSNLFWGFNRKMVEKRRQCKVSGGVSRALHGHGAAREPRRAGYSRAWGRPRYCRRGRCIAAPRPRTSRCESGSQRTLSRMLVFAVLGSASGAATVEEQLEHTLATGVRSQRCVCATRSVLTSWCMRPHHCSRPRSVSRPCTCAAVGRGWKERRAGRSGCSVNGRRGWLEAQRDVGGVVNGEAQGCYIRERQSVGEGLRAGARGVRLAPRRQGAAVGAAGRAASGAAGVVSVMSRARKRERRGA